MALWLFVEECTVSDAMPYLRNSHLTAFGRRLRTFFGRVLAQFRLPLVRNGYALMVSTFGSAAVGLLYWALAARLYPAEQVGIASATVSAMMLVSGVAQLGLNSFLVRFVPAASSSRTRLILSCYSAAVLASLAFCVVFYEELPYWAPHLSQYVRGSAEWAFFVLAVVGWTLFALQDSVLTGLRLTVWVPIENLVFSVLKLLLLYVLALSAPEFGILLAWLFSFLILIPPINLLIAWNLTKGSVTRSNPSNQLPRRKGLLVFWAGNYLGALAGLIASALIPVLVLNAVGPRSVAYFYGPWMVYSGLQMVAGNMAISLTTEVAADPTRFDTQLRKAIKHTLLLLLPAAGIVLVMSPWILALYGHEYVTFGTSLLRWLAVAAVPNGLVALALGVARLQNRGLVVGIIMVTTSGFGVALGLVLLPYMGIAGMGLSWACVQTIFAVVLLIFVIRPEMNRPHAIVMPDPKGQAS